MRDFTNKWGKKIASRPTKGGYSWCIDNGPNAEMRSLFHSWTGTPQNWASLETFPFKPLDILTKLQIYSSRSYFRIFALNIFLSTPTSAASAEWFFNKLKIVKSYLRNTKPGCEFSSQCKLARKKHFDDESKNFTAKKALKTLFTDYFIILSMEQDGSKFALLLQNIATYIFLKWRNWLLI